MLGSRSHDSRNDAHSSHTAFEPWMTPDDGKARRMDELAKGMPLGGALGYVCTRVSQSPA